MKTEDKTRYEILRYDASFILIRFELGIKIYDIRDFKNIMNDSK